MNFTLRHKLLVPVSMVMKAYWVFHIKLKLVIDGRKNNLLYQEREHDCFSSDDLTLPFRL